MLILVVLLLLLTPDLGMAQNNTSVHHLINFQARVTDGLGAPVADGSYPAQFVIHTHSVNVADIWTENAMVEVAGGVFTHNLGSVTALDWTFTQIADSMWLEVTFDGELLSPRTLLVSTATSHVAGSIEVEGNSDNLVSLRTTKHQLSQYGSDGGEQVRIWGPSWGELLLDAGAVDGANDDVLLSSNNGNGGLLALRKGGGGSGATLFGGGVGGGATLSLTNDVGTTTIFMDADQSADDAVELPAGSISAIEELNEPGIASVNSTATTSLPLFSNTTLATQTITAPSSGYVLAIGTCQIEIGHTNGTTDSAQFWVAPGAAIPGSGSMVHMIPSSASTGAYYDIITLQAIYSVLTGAQTFNLVGSEKMGSYSVRKRQLSLVFIPTAYGTYEAPSDPGDDDELFDAVSSPDAADAKALASETQRLKEELSLVRARAAETTRRLTELEGKLAKQQSASALENPE